MMSSMTPLQSSSIPLQTSAVGAPGVALQVVLVPVVAHTIEPLRRQAPTPTEHGAPVAVHTPPQLDSLPPQRDTVSRKLAHTVVPAVRYTRTYTVVGHGTDRTLYAPVGEPAPLSEALSVNCQVVSLPPHAGAAPHAYSTSIRIEGSALKNCSSGVPTPWLL